MPGFAYPTPFEFDGHNEVTAKVTAKPTPTPTATATEKPKKKEKGPMILTERRLPPSRSKSNDDHVFTVRTPMPAPNAQRPMGPKTKSGRHLPKPAPSIPIRGRNPPPQRKVGKSQSSNLELMQAAARNRSSSVPKSTRVEQSPEKKPISLKNLLMKNKSDANSLSSDELKESLHSQQTSKSSESFKSGSFNFLARKPAANNRTTSSTSSDYDTLLDRSDHEPNNARAKTTHRRPKSSTKDPDDDTNTKKGKPKSFKQLLAKTQPHSKPINGATKLSPKEIPKSDREGRTTDISPMQRSGRDSRANSPPERDLSLSPVEVKKPGSLLTNLLDSLYDSYIDPKANEDDDSEDNPKFQSSVSRFDLSFSSLF